jgi:hypothetical protein
MRAMSDKENRIQTRVAAIGLKWCRPVGIKLSAIYLLAVMLVAVMSLASQQTIALAQKEESLFSKIEQAVKVKEPDWKLVQRDERKGAEHKYFMHGWTLAEEYVSTTTYQMTDTTEAVKSVAEFIRSPISAPVRRTEIQGLGDEAYTIGDSPYGKKGAGTLIVRRVNIIIRLDASSLETAKRFAKHMLDEVDAMCGGALCEPMNSSNNPLKKES